jgi:hypothetical protein
MNKPRSQRGRPVMADTNDAQKILGRLQRLSEPFKTKIEIVENVGKVSI